jgi:hypothetical protein
MSSFARSGYFPPLPLGLCYAFLLLDAEESTSRVNPKWEFCWIFSQIVNVGSKIVQASGSVLIVGRLSLNPPSFLPVIHPVRDAISAMLMTSRRFQLWRVTFARPDVESKDSEFCVHLYNGCCCLLCTWCVQLENMQLVDRSCVCVCVCACV